MKTKTSEQLQELIQQLSLTGGSSQATNTPVTWAKGRHKSGGNLVLADGSAYQVLNQGLQQIFTDTGFATNRLAMP